MGTSDRVLPYLAPLRSSHHADVIWTSSTAVASTICWGHHKYCRTETWSEFILVCNCAHVVSGGFGQDCKYMIDCVGPLAMGIDIFPLRNANVLE